MNQSPCWHLFRIIRPGCQCHSGNPQVFSKLELSFAFVDYAHAKPDIYNRKSLSKHRFCPVEKLLPLALMNLKDKQWNKRRENQRQKAKIYG